MILYAIRHGQTDFNKNRLVQGWTDHPLNEMGMHQAIQMGHYLRNHSVHFDHIISSPLIRSQKTAEIIQDIMGSTHPILIHREFIERDFGIFEGNGVDETLEIISKPNFMRDGYEHDKALLQRIQKGLETLYNLYPNSQILLSCHSHVSKALLILSNPQKYTFRTYLNNASLCVFEYDGQTLKTLKYNIEATE